MYIHVVQLYINTYKDITALFLGQGEGQQTLVSVLSLPKMCK